MAAAARTRRLTVNLPVDLAEKVAGAAELSHRTVDEFVTAVLARELARWDEAFRVPAPPPDSPAAGPAGDDRCERRECGAG